MARITASLLALALGPGLAQAVDGQLDPAFGDGGRQGIAFDIADRAQLKALRRSDLIDKHYLFGSSDQWPSSVLLARLLPDGAPDPQFGVNGRTRTPLPDLIQAPAHFHLAGAEFYVDGKLLVFGGLRPANGAKAVFPGVVCRLYAAAGMDATHGNGGCTTLRSFLSDTETCTVTAVASAPGPRVLAIGNCQAPDLPERPFIARLMPDGSIDSEYGGGAGIVVPAAPVTDVKTFAFRALRLRPDGRAVVLGELAIDTGVSQNVQPGLWQFGPAGSADGSFSGDGFVPASFRDLEINPARAIDLALDGDGRATVLAGAHTANNRRAVLMARFLDDGQPDNGFGVEGRVVDELDVGQGADSRANALALDPQGRALVAGRWSQGLSGARDRAGTDFWLQFLTPAQDKVPPKLWISGESAATGVIVGKRDNLQLPFQVQPGQITEVTLPLNYNPGNSQNHVIDDIGLHISASAPVVVQAFGGAKRATDSQSLLPTSELGTDYRIHAWNYGLGKGSTFTAVATAPGTTTLLVRPSEPVDGYAAGQGYQVTLQQGQTYQLHAVNKELSGTRVTSDKPIAVFSGHTCAMVPDTNVPDCEQVVEQMIPVSQWGTDFVAEPLPGRPSGSVLSVLAHESGTLVSINGASADQLQAGQPKKFPLNAPLRLRASRPVSVVRFARGCEADQQANQPCLGDPAMATVRPRDAWSTRQIAVVPPYPVVQSDWTTPRHHVSVVARASDIGQLKLDGVAVTPDLFSPVGDGEHVVAVVQTTPGAHVIESASPFSATVHAFSVSHAYAFLAAHAPLPGQAPTADDMLVRYRPDGSRDGSFGIGGFAVFDHAVLHPTAITSIDEATSVQVDGTRVVVGSRSALLANGGNAQLVAYRIDASGIFSDGFEDD